jgi:hypothetical protein
MLSAAIVVVPIQEVTAAKSNTFSFDQSKLLDVSTLWAIAILAQLL